MRNVCWARFNFVASSAIHLQPHAVVQGTHVAQAARCLIGCMEINEPWQKSGCQTNDAENGSEFSTHDYCRVQQR